ncbi:hypothetical protein R5R35_006481 [Gryllus longicercus]|uniref:Uncharacterized protein n=1 Tax=Gryllus longicercus TaxID=2509291 RepID=A0AAN9VDY6_9ORTH
MKVCIFPSCVKSEERTPEKSFFKEPDERSLPKRCDRHVKIASNSSQNALESEDNSSFKKDLDNYMTGEQTNTTPLLSKDSVAHNFVGSKQEINSRQCLDIQEETAMESNSQALLKDRVNVNILKKPCGSYSQKEDIQHAASFSCLLCQSFFSSQDSLAAHFSKCIKHLEFAHGSSSGPAATYKEPDGLGKLEPVKIYDCKVCAAKFAVKGTCERHKAKCEYQHKQENKDQKSNISPMKPELPIFYYCNICFVGFDEEHAWECHLAKCEYHPKEGKKDQGTLTTSFTKDPSKDVLHEKVIEDESWLVTSLPQGYECVDAMFVVEAEGTCMLQQQIPVESEEEQLEDLEEQKENVLAPDRGVSPLEQDMLPPWPLSLLAGALEAEEEKEMMEQKLVLEPRLMQNAFMYMKGRPSEDFVETEEEPPEVACH